MVRLPITTKTISDDHRVGRLKAELGEPGRLPPTVSMQVLRVHAGQQQRRSRAPCPGRGRRCRPSTSACPVPRRRRAASASCAAPSTSISTPSTNVPHEIVSEAALLGRGDRRRPRRSRPRSSRLRARAPNRAGTSGRSPWPGREQHQDHRDDRYRADGDAHREGEHLSDALTHDSLLAGCSIDDDADSELAKETLHGSSCRASPTTAGCG